VESQLLDTVKVGFGLATGSGDPRSTNQTFTNSFEKPTVRIDYAFAEWKPIDWFKISGGKLLNPLWRPSDLLWDSDITPEGVAALFPFKISKEVELFLNTGFFILDESSSGSDPNMYVLQPGITWKFMEEGHLKVAAAYYGFNSVEGSSLDYSSGTNTLSNGDLVYDYDSYALSGEIAFKKLADFSLTSAFTEYVNNRGSR
jgi:hypothetical protein